MKRLPFLWKTPHFQEKPSSITEKSENRQKLKNSEKGSNKFKINHHSIQNFTRNPNFNQNLLKSYSFYDKKICSLIKN